MPNTENLRSKRRALARAVSIVRGQNQLNVKNQADYAEINLLANIGKSWMDDSGITEGEFRNALDAIPIGKPVKLNINSQGGNVNDGLGIYHAICDRSADITAKITGYACSIASVLPLGAAKVVAPKSSIWMIHCAWGFAQGNAADMRKQAEMLDVHDESMCGIYCDHTGMGKKKVMEMMQAETWMNGSEAVEMGLADETEEDDDARAQLRPLSNEYLARCFNVPQSILATVRRDTPTPEPIAPSPVLAVASSLSSGSLENQNQQPIKNMSEPSQTAPAPAAPSNDALATVQAQLANERRARITAEVTRRAENKITNDNLNWWIDQAVKDEAGTIKQIDSMPLAHVGAGPLGSGVDILPPTMPKGWTGACGPTEKVANILKAHELPKARFKAMRDNWNEILADAFRRDKVPAGVFGANTYSATLTTNFLILGATTKLSPKFAAIKAFSRDVSVDPYKPLATGVMKFTSSVQDGSNVLTNATNFEQTTQEVDAVSITVSQYTAPSSITNSDLNSGIRMDDISHATLMSLGSKVVQVLVTPITAANFTATPVVCALDPNVFNFGTTRKAWSLIPKANIRNLILNPVYSAGLLNQPGYFQKGIEQENGPGHWTDVFGWDNVFENTEWSTADAGVNGFACDPQAIGVIAGLPLINNAGIPGGILSVSTGTIPGCDLPIAAYMWFNTGARTYWISFDAMFGANLLDATAGVLIKSS